MDDFTQQIRNETAIKSAAPTILIIKEGWAQSWLRDASTFTLFLALIGIGILLQSTALQWVGALIGFFHIAGNARRMLKRDSLTIPEARAKLDALETGQ